jgi:hypothetical protein
MVGVLVIGPKVRGFKPTRGDEFLRAIQILSTPFLGGAVKPLVLCRKILRHVKITSKYEKIYLEFQIHNILSQVILLCY